MKYTCNNCKHQFTPTSPFETNCPNCQSEDTIISDKNKSGIGNLLIDFITKKPNRYIGIIILFLVICFKFCGNSKEESGTTYYDFKADRKDDHITFYIEVLHKDDKGNIIGDKSKLTGNQIEKFGIYVIQNGKPVKLKNLVDGDKFFPCYLSPDGFQFVLDPKREMASSTIKFKTKSISWVPTKLNLSKCVSIPVELTHISFHSSGTNIVIKTNVDSFSNQDPIYFSITGPKGPFIKNKKVWSICEFTEIDICGYQEDKDTVYADGAHPFVVDRSKCPCSAEESAQLEASITNAGNALGRDLMNTQLLQNFENSFGRIGSGIQSVKFSIPGRNNITYMQFISFIMGIEEGAAPRFTCNVIMTDCNVKLVIFK